MLSLGHQAEIYVLLPKDALLWGNPKSPLLLCKYILEFPSEFEASCFLFSDSSFLGFLLAWKQKMEILLRGCTYELKWTRHRISIRYQYRNHSEKYFRVLLRILSIISFLSSSFLCRIDIVGGSPTIFKSMTSLTSFITVIITMNSNSTKGQFNMEFGSYVKGTVNWISPSLSML